MTHSATPRTASVRPSWPERGTPALGRAERLRLRVWRLAGLGIALLAAAGLAVRPAPVYAQQPAAQAAGSPAPAAQGDGAVVRATLDNGLRLIVVRNTLAPVVSTSVNYLVGSNESPGGFPGMAHAQEHMMFRGSPGLSADQLAAIGNIMGGEFNANTREALTQYLYTVPAEDLNVALHIEALRMQGILDSQAAWSEERGAIEQEVAQDLSSPNYVLYSKLRRILFAGTPYAHDALGTRPSFDKTTAQMLKAFYDHWYAPNNAILIVAGDVEPDRVVAQVKQLFGGIKSKKLPPRPAIDLQPVKAQSIEVNTNRPTGTRMIAWRMPGLDSPDFPALEVLSDVLNSQRFALYDLVAQGKAVGAYFALDPMKKASMAYAAVSFAPGQDVDALDKNVRSILANVKKNGVPADLVAAAKLQERSEAEFQKTSIDGLASVWSEAVAVYGLHSPAEDLERIEKVTPADVQRVAAKYIDLSNAVSATMVPHGSGRPVAAGGSGFGGQETIHLGKSTATQLPEWAAAKLSQLQVPKLTTNPVESLLPNGLRLIVQPENVSDTVSVYGHIRNRPEVEEPKGKEGVDDILEQLFNYGTEHHDRLAFQQALDAIGAMENAGSDFGVQVLANDFDRGVELLAENELHPALPKQPFEILRAQLAQITAARNQSPSFLTQLSLKQSLLPKDDPSLRHATAETVKGLTLDDAVAYYRYAFRPDLATIVVIGNVTPDAARKTIEKYFGDWSAKGPKPETELPKAPPNMRHVVAVPDSTRVQDIVVLAEVMTLTRHDEDYYALELGNAVLGGGFYTARLSVELRKKQGLVYSVGSGIQAGRNRSVFLAQYASDPQNVDKAAQIVRQEFARMQNNPVPAEELHRVKAYLLRQIPLGESGEHQIARGFIQRVDDELPLDEPRIAAERFVALSPAQVEKAFAKWVRPDDFVQVSQGPPPK